MKFVALLSGGKDSCYNIVHCQSNGHELLAAASLGPEEGKDEIDSYMYQTVGQDAVHLVADALEVPLYRHVIAGTAIQQGPDYGSREGTYAGPPFNQTTEGDETEDLFELLSHVKRVHPDIRGVSAGAILSNYQRVRIEHVCRRLSLTALCYLWQRDQSELLQEMIEADLDAVFIKVAGIGLTTKHLGKSLSQMQATLLKLHRLYGAHVCGEGGEYETLTLDCPAFKSRIILKEVETVIHADQDFATVAFLRIKSAILERKSTLPQGAAVDPPPLVSSIWESLEGLALDTPAAEVATRLDRRGILTQIPSIGTDLTTAQRGNWVAIGNIQRAPNSVNVHLTLECEVRECFTTMRMQLERLSLSLADVAHINLSIASMGLFSEINTVYSEFFGSSPPTRACVAVELPNSVRVRMDCLACRLSDRVALHVQGLSYWAPANIGPYSQAVIVDQLVFISGQIGLIPASLTMPQPSTLALEAALSFQHVGRIINVLQHNAGGGWTGRMLSAICWTGDTQELRNTSKLWCASTDVQSIRSPPVVFTAVPQLPRTARIEIQIMLHTGRGRGSRAEMDNDEEEITWTTENERHESGAGLLEWETLSGQDGTISGVIFAKINVGDLAPLLISTGLLKRLADALTLRMFYVNRESAVECVRALETHDQIPAITGIPVHGLASCSREGWELAMMYMR